MEVVEVKGGVAVLLSEHSCNGGILELVIKKGPFVVKLDHCFNAFLTLLLEQCGGGVLRGGVQCWCMFWTGYL